MGQHFIVNLDELERLAGGGLINGGNGRNGVAIVKRLLAGHAVFQNVAHAAIIAGEVWQIGAGDDGFYAGQLFSL